MFFRKVQFIFRQIANSSLFLIALLSVLAFIEWINIRYGFDSRNELTFEYFNVFDELISKWPFLMLTVGALLCSYVCLTSITSNVQTHLFLKFIHRKSFWLLHIATASIYSIIFSLTFSIVSYVSFLQYKTSGSLLVSESILKAQSHDYFVQLNNFNIFCYILLTSFFCFWVMSSLCLLIWWKTNQIAVGFAAIILINVLDQLGIPLYFSVACKPYMDLIKRHSTDMILTPIFWISGIIILGIFLSRKKEIYGHKN